jgi:hypothetical protein
MVATVVSEITITVTQDSQEKLVVTFPNAAEAASALIDLGRLIQETGDLESVLVEIVKAMCRITQ